jgi:hypothetical protein
MKIKLAVGAVLALLSLAACAFAQEEETRIKNLVASMKTELNLTQDQADAITPIMKEYAAKREELKQDLQENMAMDNSTIQRQMDKLDKEESQKISQILSPEQIKKWNNKQQIRSGLNRDKTGDSGWRSKGTQNGMGMSF